MTTRPQLTSEGNWAAGIAAVALFAVLAGVFLTAEIAEPAAFPASESIVENIGYAMFNLESLSAIPSEGFLISFILIAIVLDAALDGSLMLAKREEEESEAMTDGGRSSAADGGDDGSTGGDE
jgi:NADH-quinone oxidoreductase subunit J